MVPLDSTAHSPGPNTHGRVQSRNQRVTILQYLGEEAHDRHSSARFFRHGKFIIYTV